MTTRRVITAGIALLLSVAALTACSDDKPTVPGVPKYTPSASATATSATSGAATTTAKSAASSSGSAATSTPATSGSTSTTTAAAPSPTSTEPTPAPSTAANGTVTTHMDAKDMPPKPAPPVAPQLPPQAFTKTDTGAVITAMMFVEIASYVQATGDSATFDELFTADCKLCNERRDVFLHLKQTGRYIIAATELLEDPKVTDRLDDAVRVEGNLISPSATVYDAKAGIRKVAPAGRQSYYIDLVWDEDRWLVYAGGAMSKAVRG